MRLYIVASFWAVALLLVALSARLGWVEDAAADLLLMVMPMIAFVTLVGDRGCRPAQGTA